MKTLLTSAGGPRSRRSGDKRSFYRDPAIVEAYDARRFGGRSGAWVNQRELDTVINLLPPRGRILDLGCGTGQLASYLGQIGETAGPQEGRPLTLALSRGEREEMAAPGGDGRGTGSRDGEGGASASPHGRGRPQPGEGRPFLATVTSRSKLTTRAHEVIGLDTSEPMLLRAAETGTTVVAGDAFALPFPADSFDAIAALRLAFHYPDVGALLAAVRQQLRDGGTFILDTYNWTPRSVIALDRAGWGERVYVHRCDHVKEAAQVAGFRVAAARVGFLFSPYVYRLLPFAVVNALARLEEGLPALPRARTFWGLERVA